MGGKSENFKAAEHLFLLCVGVCGRIEIIESIPTLQKEDGTVEIVGRETGEQT